jgi:DNA invertase Pin-like site-specific DNA recombinase
VIRRSTRPSQNNRASGYVRRSTDRQEQSIPDQKKALESYCVERHLRLVKFYVDDAISGASTAGRRAFQQMIKDAQGPARDFDIIVVYDVKRFGRIDNDEAGYYRYLLRTHGVELQYVSENFNGDSTDDLLRPVKQWQARQESKDLSKVTIRGLLSKSETGCWMGGVPPYGYDLRYENADGRFLLILRFIPDGSKQILDESGRLIRTLARGESLNISKRDQAKLVPSHPDRVKVIKRIFNIYVDQERGYRGIADTLNQENIPTPRGPEWAHIYSGKWTDTTIRAILVNPLYSGDMVWNRRTDGRFHRISGGRAVDRDRIHGARLVPNGKDDWIVVRDAHPALISRRLFEQARQRLENHPKSIEQRRRLQGRTWKGCRGRFILSGLMTCSHCGSRYQGLTRIKGKKRNDGTRVRTYYYACGGYITKGRKVCQLNAIPKEALESAVVQTILDFYRPYLEKGGRKKLAEAVKAQTRLESKEVVAARKRAQRRLPTIERSISNLLDNLSPANRDFVDERLQKLKLEKQQLESRLEELEHLCLSHSEIEDIVAEAMQLLSGLEFILKQGISQARLVAIRQCTERIQINLPAREIRLLIRKVPASNLRDMDELKTRI